MNRKVETPLILKSRFNQRIKNMHRADSGMTTVLCPDLDLPVDPQYNWLF